VGGGRRSVRRAGAVTGADELRQSGHALLDAFQALVLERVDELFAAVRCAGSGPR